jgi:hypothetical protein
LQNFNQLGNLKAMVHGGTGEQTSMEIEKGTGPWMKSSSLSFCHVADIFLLISAHHVTHAARDSIGKVK